VRGLPRRASRLRGSLLGLIRQFILIQNGRARRNMQDKREVDGSDRN